MESLLVMILIAAGLIVVGVILFIMRKKYLDTVMEIKYTQTSKIKDIIDNHKSISADLGKGNYSETVEVKGVSKCAKPLSSEHKKAECVWYKSEIIREYEEDVETTDSNGNRTRETRRGSETVSTIENSTPFEVEDDTGSIKIAISGAEIVAQQIYNDFQPGEYSGRINISFGRSSGRRTIGYRYTEQVIAVDQNLYILGEASDKDGQLVIKKPSDKKKKFIVSVKSEEELIKQYMTTATIMLVGSIILPLAGIGLLVYAFLFKK
jgi:E3 Ubiquitin ligase